MNINKKSLKSDIHKIIFDADTPAAKGFDIALFIAIILSITGMMLESVPEINQNWQTELHTLDWVLTIMFTMEYSLRIWTTGKPIKYVLSFYGIVDLLSIIPTYAAVFFTGAHSLSVIRAVRLLRVFRVLKLVQFVGEASNMAKALKSSMNKIIVFLIFVLIVSTIVGAIMYFVEGGENGFTSIPKGIYWAVVTLTTVGYGDISPVTGLGQFLSIIIMILGYGVIAVPTGLVTAEVIKSGKENDDFAAKINRVVTCPNCNIEKHNTDSSYCYSCGASLNG